ncbi:ABC transporter ATP-binding protein [Micromonospora ureilytica]|uniref:ABC transporter ATP-binding protein n=1 Tax=Micromonospora ureilytica TaxID=709868 RepID=UPI003F4D24D7
MSPIPDPTGSFPVPSPPLLVAEDVSKSFGITQALSGASLKVFAGEVLALTGPSGSGKSTLLHCLSGILAPDSGRVTFEGHDLTALSDRERSALRRGAFGFVFQFGQLVPELTCLENVALPLRLAGRRRKQAERLAAELLADLEVTEVAGKRPGQVSGGQGQRVAVARALITTPRMIFADEPTGALDSRNGEQVMRLLVAAAKQRGSAVVLVTHEAFIAACADREVAFADGAAVAPAVAR